MIFECITRDPKIMGGKACIRGTRVTVATILRVLAEVPDHAEVLELYPYLEQEDLIAALEYAAAMG